MFLAAWHQKSPKKATRRGHNIRKPYMDFGSMFADRPFSSIKPLDIERFQRQFSSPCSHNDGLWHLAALFNWAIRMQFVDTRNPCSPIRARKVVPRRRDYSTEQIRQIAAHIFCPVFEVPPDTASLEGLARRDMALTKGRVTAANDQMQELCNYMGILFLTMARPSDLNKAEFSHFDLEKLVWHKHTPRVSSSHAHSTSTPTVRYRSIPGSRDGSSPTPPLA
ncbi:hypothetical protein [Mesorhizobium silamurunense]|uniref:hypothetical protein n=1 Tax=Mesorhizobium silamurunense TaxID=499528 RepID=UPI001FEF4B05|nr:hypothetical protein [Mesorhizobium silamurunense]